MSTENKNKDQSWIRKIWLGNKLTIILIFILIIYLWFDVFFLGALSTKLMAQYLRALPINGTDFLFAMILGLIILYVLSLCIDAALPDIQKNKIMSHVEETIISILPVFVSLLLANIAYTTWARIHQKTPEIIQLTCLFIFVLLSVVALTLTFEELNKKAEDSITWRVIKRGFLPFIPLPLIVIVSLLILDLTAFFTGSDLATLYKDTETRSFLFTLYAGAFAFFAFGVTLYVAHIRHTSLKLAEKQFIYTQTQKHGEEIEKRFQEGIKLLGNEQESVRLGGIFVLWEIVKDAVKALPYLKNEHVYYAERIDDDKQIDLLPFHLEIPCNENIDADNQTELKKRYKEKQSASDAEISAYLKAFSLHEQILNILCAYIRTRTNSESYLKENYPSIYQKRYSHEFKETFGKKGEFNHIEERTEKPSHEIQSLLDLLLKIPNKKKIQGFIAEPINIPVQILDFQLNLTQAILKGGNFDNACFIKSSCDEANFQHSSIKFASFYEASLHKTDFQNAQCLDSSFELADCFMANFQNAFCPKANFQSTKCSQTNFQNANFCYAKLQKAQLNKANFQNAACCYTNFEGASCFKTVFQQTDLSHATFKGVDISLSDFTNALYFDSTKWVT